MARFKKQKIELNEDSLRKLLDEMYRQASEVRTKTISDANMLRKILKENIEDIGTVQTIAKALVEMVKNEQGSLEKKLNIARIMKDYIISAKKTEPEEEGPQGEGKVPGFNKLEIQKLMKEANLKSRE